MTHDDMSPGRLICDTETPDILSVDVRKFLVSHSEIACRFVK